MDAKKELSDISSQVAVCTRCQLHYSRKKSVPGEGPLDATVLLIGEAPGFYENEQGRPFVGAAGKFLDELLEKGGVNRQGVFITNVVKCRPPGNRDPLPEELSACNDYLERQIETIHPKVIVTLGRYSMGKFMPNAKISEVHGQPTWNHERMIIPMYHPAAALQQPTLKSSLERDFAKLSGLIQQAWQHTQPTAAASSPAPAEAAAKKAEQKPAIPPQDETPTQLSLF